MTRAAQPAAAAEGVRSDYRHLWCGLSSLGAVLTWTPPPLPAAVVGAASTTFVGRLRDLAELERAWDAVMSGERQVVFVGGEPGVGKTRLATEAATALHHSGAAVLWGACHPEFDAPYRPFVTAIEHLLEAAEEGALADVLSEAGAPLLRLTPHVGRHRSSDVETQPSPSRLELFDAVANLLVALARRHPLVLVLDDIHWASAPTLQLLTHVVRVTAGARLLLLATHRSTDPDRSDALTYTIADLYRHDGVARIDLVGLATDEIADYLVRESGLGPRTARGSAAVLHDHTGGNPFFLREVWRELVALGGVDALRSDVRHAPRSVRDMLHRRLAELGDAHTDVIQLAAVAGSVVDLPVLLDASEHPRSTTLAAIDRGVGSGVLVADTGTAGRYRFVHALARQAVIDRIAPSRRVLHHARLARALERLESQDPGTIRELAHHFDAAHALGFVDDAVRYLVRAAEHAARSLAHEEAAALYARAADLPASAEAARDDLLFAAARSRMLAGDFSGARDAYEQLAKSEDPDVLLRAAIGHEDASWRPGLFGERSLELLERAMRRGPTSPDDGLFVRALASSGRALSFTGAAARARDVGEEALQLARLSGDDGLVAHALGATLWQGMTPTLAPGLLARAIELSELGLRLGNDDHLGPAAFYRAVFGYLLGLPGEWSVAAADLGRAARAGGQPFFRYVAGCEEYARRYAGGDFDGAFRTVAGLADLDGEFGPDTTEGSYGMQMFMLKRATGGLADVRGLVTGDEDPGAHWAPGLLALYCELGLWSAAAQVLSRLVARLAGHEAVPAQWAGVLAFMADAAAMLDDRDVAAVLRPHVAEYAGLNLISGQFVAVFGSADRYIGALDSVLGADTADVHFASALDMDRRMGAVTHEAETLAAWSRHVHRRRGADDAHAAGLRRAAREIAEDIGHRRVLRELGLGPSAGTPSRSFPDGLTPREVQVLRLVAEGLSNREIGERLFISQNTAANHVRSILMKIGAPNRTRAAIYAARHDLLE